MNDHDKADKIVIDKNGVAVDADRANLDPITKEAGSHPVGTGLGAAGAGTAGAIVGTGLAGPIGGVIGAAIGASVGGALGHYAAEAANPTYVAVEPVLRRDFASRPYAADRNYEEYEDAYVFGAAERERVNAPWTDEVETDLRGRWDTRPISQTDENQRLDWERARPAVRDAWDESERLPPR